MERWTRTAAGAAAVAVIGATTVGIARSRWMREGREDIAQLRERTTGSESTSIPLPSAVPRCVARYLDAAFALDQRRIRAVRLRQRGELRGDARASWNHFNADEYVSTEPPGFVWDANVCVGRIPLFSVHDRYIDGRASVRGSVLGALPLAAPSASPLLDAAGLMRFAAEAAWYPTVLEPGPYVRWEDRGEDEARLEMHHGNVEASLDVRFDGDGMLAEVAGERGRAIGRELVPTRWIARYGEYRRIDGMMIPCAAEVSWAPTDGEFAVWRARLDEIAYEYA
ncbi:MAG: hypothetical protein KGN02_12905 [bacterium]|nr:hypothetical protein [bacterium]